MPNLEEIGFVVCTHCGGMFRKSDKHKCTEYLIAIEDSVEEFKDDTLGFSKENLDFDSGDWEGIYAPSFDIAVEKYHKNWFWDEESDFHLDLLVYDTDKNKLFKIHSEVEMELSHSIIRSEEL